MKERIKFILSVLIGNALIAFAVCAFVIPNDIMLGGSNGIALFVQKFFPVRLSILSAIINAILFFICFYS